MMRHARLHSPLLPLVIVLTLLTILIWCWLFWRTRQPDLLVMPACIIAFGLYCHHILRASDPFDRLYLFVRLRRLFFFSMLMLLSQVFLQAAWVSITGASPPAGILDDVSWGTSVLYFFVCLRFSLLALLLPL